MPLHKDDPKSVGGYKLLDRLGAGGMGAVYLGRSRSGREVAVKVVHAQYAEDPVFRTRFRQEIEAVRKVSGAFTAPVVDADPEAARPWMATQYVSGHSLARRIRDHGALREGELRQLALGLVEALRDIHRAGVVHRDLKPANVLMAEDGPRVIDFGISRAAENHNTLTETGQMIGTPPFMSPEQLTDARTVGPASDVFSLGALLVYALTGRGPFDADSPYLTAYRVVHDVPVLDGLAEPLRGVLAGCLAKEAADRPELDDLARQFATALPEADTGEFPTVTLRGDAPLVPPTRPGTVADPAPTPRPGRRRRIRPLLAATGTVGALVLGLTAYLLIGPGQAESDAGASPAPSPASRWAALPEGWKPWRTTLFEPSSVGGRKPLGASGGLLAGEPGCRMHEEAVYCAGDGILPVRLDGRSGRTVWRAQTVPADTDGGRYSARLIGVQDGAVIVSQSVATDSAENDPLYVLGLDTETGEQLWKSRADHENIEAALSGGLLMTSTDGVSVSARSPRTGAVRWTVKPPPGYYCAFLGSDTGVYAQCTPAGVLTTGGYRLLALDPSDGSMRNIRTPDQTGVLGVLDGRVVMMQMASGEEVSVADAPYERVLLIDPDTGATTSVKLAKSYEGDKPVLSGGTLWFASRSGLVTAVSPLTGKQLWQTQTSLEQPGAPTYDTRTRTLYLASVSGRVAALDGREGESLWETLPRTSVSSSDPVNGPLVLLHQGALVVGTPNGTLFSVDPAHPEEKPAEEPASG
ncbi:protein kinase domain-containing protein [Streptomyces sp. NPDC001658]